MTKDLTQGGITKTLVQFSLPMIAGNLLQQLYNIADTLIVGRFSGGKCSGSGGLGLYPHDLSHLDSAWSCHGQRGAGVHLLGSAGTASGCAIVWRRPSR